MNLSEVPVPDRDFSLCCYIHTDSWAKTFTSCTIEYMRLFYRKWNVMSVKVTTDYI